ncbi:hypothetical protein SeMB42_g03140 [Synchytrium endobioticum]|nr:hypothetical protein SeMB42_g03140 [Synchytrium endobioticum]
MPVYRQRYHLASKYSTNHVVPEYDLDTPNSFSRAHNPSAPRSLHVSLSYLPSATEQLRRAAAYVVHGAAKYGCLTYRGHVASIADALLLFEAVRIGRLRAVKGRLSEQDRPTYIKSGSVFIWTEDETGVRRWTDGKQWTTSRIDGPFLTYHEVVERHQPLKSCTIKENGLIKRAMSITARDGRKHRMVSYYTEENVRSNSLPLPTQDPDLADVSVETELYPEFKAPSSSPERVRSTSPRPHASVSPAAEMPDVVMSNGNTSTYAYNSPIQLIPLPLPSPSLSADNPSMLPLHPPHVFGHIRLPPLNSLLHPRSPLQRTPEHILSPPLARHDQMPFAEGTESENLNPYHPLCILVPSSAPQFSGASASADELIRKCYNTSFPSAYYPYPGFRRHDSI